MKDIVKIADLIKFYLQHISSNTVANVDHKTLSIPASNAKIFWSQLQSFLTFTLTLKDELGVGVFDLLHTLALVLDAWSGWVGGDGDGSRDPRLKPLPRPASGQAAAVCKEDNHYSSTYS